jgi:hypothetical protein
MTDLKFHTLAGFPRSVSPSSHATEAGGFVVLTGDGVSARPMSVGPIGQTRLPRR